MTVAEKLTAIAENQQKLYAAGAQNATSSLWDAIQSGGTRTDYSGAFSNTTWTESTFCPIYDMVLAASNSHNNMFYLFKSDVGLDVLLENQGVTLDTSNLTSVGTLFYQAKTPSLPSVDFSNASALNNTYTGATAVTMGTIKIKDDGSTVFTNVFQGCNALKSISFAGVIGTDLDIHWPPLDKASMENIVSCLSATCTGQTLSLSKTAVDTEFETAKGAADGSTSPAWNNLIATKSNWTVALM